MAGRVTSEAFPSISFHVSLFLYFDRNKVTFLMLHNGCLQSFQEHNCVINKAGALLEYNFTEIIKLIIDKKNADISALEKLQMQQSVTVVEWNLPCLNLHLDS